MKVFIYSIIGIVAVAIIGGFFIVGSPTEARLRAFDTRRVEDFDMIQSQIVYVYWQSKSKLPNTLADLEDPINGFIVPKDPETATEYAYEIKGPLTFSLCATFNRPSLANAMSVARPIAYPAGELSQNWEHGAGNVCFERTIDPDLYPPFPSKR